MSSCLIITQGNKMYIGADTACSVKTKDGYKRISNDMPKLFTLGNSVFFCSGKKADAERCVNWIFDNFERSIDFDKLGIYLRDNFNIVNEDNIFNIEFLLCDYDNHNVIQLSQYNNFEPVIYDYAEQVRIICGGYKTNDSFIMAKKNIALNESVFNIYKNVFEAISDECVGGNMIIYNSPTNYETYRLEEKNISYCNINENNLFLLTSDFVTSGVINGSQIIGGDIYSTNYSSTEGTHINLNDGSFTFGGGTLTYNKSDGLKVQGNITSGSTISGSVISGSTIKGGSININDRFKVDSNGNVTLPDNASISWGQVTGTENIPTKTDVTTITKNTVTTAYVNALEVTAKSVAAENITGTTISGKTISGGSLLIGNKTGTNNYAEITSGGILNCRGANISGTLTAGSDSIIGSSTTGWKITDNKIHTIKTMSNGDPVMTICAGTNHSNTFIIAPNCFQLGGIADISNVGKDIEIGANLIGDTYIQGNCYIMGAATASNLSITGGNIAGWKINENYLGADDCFIRADGRFKFRYMVNNSIVGSVSFVYSSNTNRCRLQLDNDCDLTIGSVTITEEQLRRLLASL